MIRDLLDLDSKVTLITRPRRFGKSLNMSMLRYFFEVGQDKKLFDGLDIAGAGERYMRHRGRYPVVTLTFKEAKQNDFLSSLNRLASEISREYQRHGDIFADARMSGYAEKFREIASWKPTIIVEEVDKAKIAAGIATLFAESIAQLCSWLEAYHGTKVVLLIDEYDVPLESSFFGGYYGEMVTFIRTLFGSALKGNSSLAFAVVTGCLRVSKESIFTGLNNLTIAAITDDWFAPYFGFAEPEVIDMLGYYELSGLFPTVKEWYDGYLFGDTQIYNPWSILNYVRAAIKKPAALPSPYWAQTSSNSIVRSIVERGGDSAADKADLETLMDGGTIEKQLWEDVVYNEIYNRADNMWSFLYLTGYLRLVDERLSSWGGKTVTFTIPNKEVLYVFVSHVSEWFEHRVQAFDAGKLEKAVFAKDAPAIQAELDRFLLHTISYHDYKEDFYHALLLGLLGHIRDCYLKSNREGGTGRGDIFLRTANVGGAAVIFEVKHTKELRELDALTEEALRQIDRKGYITEAQELGYQNIIKYGVAFYEKSCRVKVG
jgi:hypothetical protein